MDLAKLLPALLIFGGLFFFVIVYAFSRFAKSWGKGEEKKDETALMLRTVDDVVRGIRESETGLRDLYSRAERKASFLERYHHSILESMNTGVLACNRQGQITAINLAAATILGLGSDGARGERLDVVLGPRNLFGRFLDRMNQGEEIEDRLELRIDKKEEEPRWIELRTSCLRGRARQPAGITFLLDEITERKMLRRQVELKNRLAAMGEVTAGLTHEFRNAIHAINGMAKLIARRSEGADRIEPLAHDILDETAHLEASLNRLLNFAKPEEIHMEPINLPNLLDSVIRPFKESEHYSEVRFEAVVEPGVPPLLADRALINQILRNLIQNGLDAMGARGDLRLHGTCLPAIHNNVDGMGSAYVVIQVEDSGPGIPETVRQKIFTPFFTTKKEGTGLGLPLVQKLVSAHGGSLDVECPPGGGTTMSIYLPAKERKAGRPGDPPERSKRRARMI